MYHQDKPHVIEADDIETLHEVQLKKKGEDTLAHLVVKLRPHKDYTTDGFRLHLTNGVSHRFLEPEPPKEEETPKKESKGATQETEPEAVESTPSSAAKVRKH